MTKLRDVQQQVADLKEKLQASGDILERTIIAAPQAGKITGMRFHTIGGVIAPGAPLMDIVPQNNKLVKVTQLSADKFTDEKTGQAYYLTRIEISEAALLDYMNSPIIDSMRRSFGE